MTRCVDFAASPWVNAAAQSLLTGIADQIGEAEIGMLISCSSQAVVYQIDDWQQHAPAVLAALSDLLVVLACRSAILNGSVDPLEVHQRLMVSINRRFNEHASMFAHAALGGKV